MSNFLLVVLDNVEGTIETPSIVSLVFNFLSFFLLICSLFPHWLDVRRKKMTYGLSKEFFSYFIAAAFFMSLNAIFSLANAIVKGLGWDSVLFYSFFLVVNLLSIFFNSYILSIKTRNIREAEKRNMTEQEYYESVIKLGIIDKRITK